MESPYLYNSGKNRRSPIAIVGIGCRFPGGITDATSCWELLREGRDAITEVPPDRWNADLFYSENQGAYGRMVTKWGGFLDEFAKFDAGFFGIPPREAIRLDPQQRWLLEVSWEALEDACVAPSRLRKSRTGVFVGIAGNDYRKLQVDYTGSIDLHTNIGNTSSIAANRLSYFFDFLGPSLAVDTACSSAMVAVHLGCQSIWSGESEAALVGGVNSLLLPHATIGFSKASMLSPNGRCHAFDHRADGYVRAEGLGMLYLKPEADAIRDGNPIYATILSSVVNQDGKTSSMPVPGLEAQKRMLKEALEAAEVDPEEVAYIEAHGTGTPVGDPIEARALGEVVSSRRAPGDPCLVGSIKTNIGHLECASGVAGIVKAALVLKNREIPRNLHFAAPNPNIPFEDLKLSVVDEPTPLPSRGRDRPIALVNSFGFGGTNGCVVLEAPGKNGESEESVPVNTCGPYFLLLSAKGPNALRDASDAMRSRLGMIDESELGDLCREAAVSRERHPDRLVVYGDGIVDLSAGLEKFDGSTPDETRLTSGSGLEDVSEPVFIYTGQGAQWWGMGQRLMRDEPVFRDAVSEVDRLFRQIAPWSVLEEMSREECASKVGRTEIAQPCLFALQVGLTELWRSRGVHPAMVLGHSVGEVAAAWAAGIFTLDEATRIVFHRSRLQGAVGGNGAMAAVGIPAENAPGILEPFGGRIEIAAFNDPNLLTLAGEAEALEELLADLEKQGNFVRRLPIPFAFHSRQMDPIREDLVRELRDILGREGSIPFVSTVSGRRMSGSELGPGYWWGNVRKAVDFAGAMGTAIDSGKKLFVEIGPHPVLTRSVGAILSDSGQKGFAIPSLKRDLDEVGEFRRNFATFALRGGKIDWKALYPVSKNRAVRFPGYPWQREKFWLERGIDRRTRLENYRHPLLGHRTDAPSPVWEVPLDPLVLDYLDDHKFWDRIVFPVAGFAEIAMAVARELHADEKWVVEDLEVERILFVSAEQTARLRIECDERNGFAVHIFSQSADSEPWSLHVKCRLSPEVSGPGEDVDTSALRSSFCGHVAHWDFYEDLQNAGYPYGENFRGVEQVFYGPGESLAEIVAPKSLADATGGYFFHPALLDSCFQAFRSGLVGLEEELSDASNSGRFYLPGAIASFRIHVDELPLRFWVHTKIVDVTEKNVFAELRAYDRQGRHLASVRGFRLDESPNSVKAKSDQGIFYHLQWEKTGEDGRNPAESLDGRASQKDLIVISPENSIAKSLEEFWEYSGGRFARFDIPECENERHPLRDRFDRLGWETAAPPAVLFLGALLHPAEAELDSSLLALSQSTGVLGAANLIAAMARSDLFKKGAELHFAAWGSETGDLARVERLASAPLLGLVRVVESEHPGFSPKWIELDPRAESEAPKFLIDEILASDPETEVSYRNGERFGRHLRRVPKEQLPRRAKRAAPDSGTAFRLESDRPGDLGRLSFHEFRRQDPGPDELEIRVEAVGLNFRDLMKALAIYPGEGEELRHYGDDFSGTVTRVGGAVTGFSPGDSVTGIAPHALASHVLATEATVFPKPPDLSHPEAATIPTVFLTAHYCLRNLARMRPGESILIHSGGGGVGQAAIQIAQTMGLTIFSTAGSEEKREKLRGMGVAHVFSSRTLEFSDRILEITKGRGVDAVLNSLAGEFLVKSLSVLAPYGRFLEIGKIDIYADRRISLKAMRENVSYFVVDMARYFDERPAEARTLVDEIRERFDSGVYRSLPYRSYATEEVETAFRWMASGSHVGKIVIDLASGETPVLPASDGSGFFRGDRSYLVAGGAEGFGLQVARWLVQQGVRHLALISRHGPKTEKSAELISRLKEEGVDVRDLRTDLRDDAAVETAIQEIEEKLPPLAGVFFSAMVVDDGTIAEIGLDRFRKALDPKMLGAWNLHRRTLGRDLDHFVCFSSFSGVVGGPRQSNYNAGNLFLDALSHYRRSTGLPCLTINWGPLTGTGYLERNGRSKEYLEAIGAEGFRVEEATGILRQLLHLDVPQIMACRFNWRSAHRIAPAVSRSNFFSEVREEATSNDWSGSILPSLLAAPQEQRERIVEEFLLAQIAGVFGGTRESLDRDTPVTQLGLDSLMSIELVNRLEANLGVPVPLGTILNGPSIRELSLVLLDAVLASRDMSEGKGTTGAH